MYCIIPRGEVAEKPGLEGGTDEELSSAVESVYNSVKPA